MGEEKSFILSGFRGGMGLADEVGMGKTFVALGLAYSILAHLKKTRVEPDLAGTFRTRTMSSARSFETTSNPIFSSCPAKQVSTFLTAASSEGSI